MSKIIVVGLGHGGLIAAAKLAESGHEVVIFEKRLPHEIGHEWEDRFDFDLLARIIGKDIADFPEGSWRYRGDCTFVSPDKRTVIDVHFAKDKRQKIMWRKPLIGLLVDYARSKGVEIRYQTEVSAPVVKDGKVVGVIVEGEKAYADLVVDASGVFSVLRKQLPDDWGIEKEPTRGDVFYANRAYYDRVDGYPTPVVPFEIYLIHEGEQGLSWLCTNEDSVDVLIGRVYPIDEAKVEEQLRIFRASHPWLGEKVRCGGNFAVIPVRRPLTRMVGEGYAAVGDSAFMTTPMNGMGIDLSLRAGEILAESIGEKGVTIDALWAYNRKYLATVGAAAAKNEGLKNALLNLPLEGVDFLYESGVVEAEDLSGGGKNMTFRRLMRKLIHGMKRPKYFFAIVKGLMKGGKMTKLYANPPQNFDCEAIAEWSRKIEQNVVKVEER